MKPEEYPIIPDSKRRRGVSQATRNARKHGYYSSSFSGEDKSNLSQASEIIGLDDEIALLRARLKSVVEHNPDNLRLICEASSTLARLMRTNQKLGFGKSEDLERIRWNVICEYTRNLGLDMNKIAVMFLGKTDVFVKSEDPK